MICFKWLSHFDILILLYFEIYFTAEDIIVEYDETSSNFSFIFNKMNKHLKTIVSCLYLITCLLLHRRIGNVIHDIVQKFENVDISQLRKLKKISIKIGKAEIGISFLNNCKLCNIVWKFHALIYLVQTK